MAAPKILFVHQNFPAQFPFIAEALRQRGAKLAAIGSRTARNMPGIDVRRWVNHRGSTPGIVDAATKAEADLIRGEAAASAALKLKADGFVPDLIIGHPGWGETLFLNEVFPKARQILFGELYYQPTGQDVGFDPEFDGGSFAAAMTSIGKNAATTLAYAYADRIIVPTPFQASGFPKLYAPLLRILHEGVDLRRARRNPKARLILPGGKRLDGSKPVITFINRTFERLRGFHVFMRALPELLAADPDVEIVLIGQETGSIYGAPPPGGGSWKEWMMAEVGSRFDRKRVNFVGRLPHEQMIDAFSISRAHVYYTYPFVLSWSLVEAMACECLILGSDTAPVRDAITNGRNGLLSDFFDVGALSQAMIRAVREPEAFRDIKTAARETAFATFDRETVGVPGWLAEVDAVLAAG